MHVSAPAVARRGRLFLPLIAGLLITSAPNTVAQAAASASFVVPAGDSDGYGLGDCMRSGSECGRVMADAWCTAHGHLKSIAFGSAEDVTGSVAGPGRVTQAAGGEVVISCGD